MNVMHLRAVVAMSLGGLLFGFDTAVVSGITEALRVEFELSPAGLGQAISAALWGTLVGAIFSGAPGDRWGSLPILRIVGLLYVASAIGCALAQDLGSFIAFRLLGGLAIGASSVLVPVYIAEISPADRRGLLVGLFQFNIVLGILCAYLSNFLVAELVRPELAWRWKLGVTAIPAVLFLLLLTGLRQTPRWLAAQGRLQEARIVIARLGLSDVELEPSSSLGRLNWHAHRKPILLAIAMGLLNQLSGINAILYYLNDVFAAAGFRDVDANLQAITIGVANLLATVAAMTIIDRFGRKPLLAGGGLLCGIALVGVGLVFNGAVPPALLLPLLLLFIIAFAMSQGAVIWVYLSEIFPSAVRARGQGIGSSTHWVANAVISFGFPVVAEVSRATPFWFFAAAMFVQAILAWRLFPETRGRALESIGASPRSLWPAGHARTDTTKCAPASQGREAL